MGRYCSYLLPKQAGGTAQIIVFKTLRMIGRPALYYPKNLSLILPICMSFAVAGLYYVQLLNKPHAAMHQTSRDERVLNL